eukprot:m.11327 g.11327  ORF g.11327 m.11327 type:complete len:380 (-) comp4420_c0_seq1:126-1265(-)
MGFIPLTVSNASLPGKIVFGTCFSVGTIGTLACGIIAVELALFERLKFQRERAIFMLASTQCLAGLFFLATMVNVLSSSSWEALYKCPDGTGHAYINGFRESFRVVAASCEVFVVLLTNYVLFLGRGALSVVVETVAYVSLVLVLAGCCVLFVIENLRLGRKICKLKQDINSTDDFINPSSTSDRVDLFIWFFPCFFVWIAYIIMWRRWKRQLKIWAHDVRELQIGHFTQEGAYVPPTASKVDRLRREKMIETHKEAVETVVSVLHWYILAFMFGSLGIGVQLTADMLFIHMDQRQSWFVLWHSGTVIYGLQRILFALAYWRRKENRVNYSCGAFGKKMSDRVKAKEGVNFRNTISVNEYRRRQTELMSSLRSPMLEDD